MKNNRKLMLFGCVLGLLLLASLTTSPVAAILATPPPQGPDNNISDSQSIPPEAPPALPVPDDNTGGRFEPSQDVVPDIQPPNVDPVKALTPPPTSEALPDANTGTAGQAITPLDESSLQSVDAWQEQQFPHVDDELVIGDFPYWWQAGDYAEGTRILDINSVSAVRLHLVFVDNALNTTGHVDLDLSINGTVVGSLSILPGETEKSVAFFFAPISTPNYVIRLEATNTVDPGAGSVDISLVNSLIRFYDSTTTLFPGTGDTFGVANYPYWWTAGDYAQGVRTLGVTKVYGVRYDLSISNNSLSGTGHVDLDLSINGTVVGSMQILPGETAKTGIFFFSPINGPTYTIRLEETNTVDPGMGSVTIQLDLSPISVYGATSSWFPATGDEVVVANDPYWWNDGDYAQGTRTPGLDVVTGIQLELLFDENVLNTTGHVDLELSINGTLVGSFSIMPGEMSKTVAFFFAPITGPIYTVRLEETNTVDPGAGSVSILLDTSAITFYDSTPSPYLPALGDIIDVDSYPYWWHAGDYAEGTRITQLGNVTSIHYNLILSNNSLNTTGHVDLELSINGVVVDTFTVLPGEMSKTRSASFAPINGPIYVLRLEATNLVDPGAGSIIIPLDRSQIQFTTTAAFLPLVKK